MRNWRQRRMQRPRAQMSRMCERIVAKAYSNYVKARNIPKVGSMTTPSSN